MSRYASISEKTYSLTPANFKSISHALVKHFNARQSILNFAAKAFYQALVESKKENPDMPFYRLRTTALDKISTRINGGRFTRFTRPVDSNGVTFIINGKPMRIDYHEIDKMMSIMVLSEEEIRRTTLKDFPAFNLKKISQATVNIGGIEVSFKPWNYEIVETVDINAKWIASRVKNSINGKLFYQMIAISGVDKGVDLQYTYGDHIIYEDGKMRRMSFLGGSMKRTRIAK